MTLRLRRHHVLCAIGFQGEGYDDAFTANMANIVRGQLRALDGANQLVRITETADAICAPCPMRRDLGCASQDKIDQLDARHGEKLDIKPGDIMTWGALQDRVVERVVPADLAHICEGCSWLEAGYCTTALAELCETKKGRPNRATL